MLTKRMRLCVLVASTSVVSPLACKRVEPAAEAPPSAASDSPSSSATVSSTTVAAPIDDLPLGATPKWPAPPLTPDRPVALRVARTLGKQVLWAYGGTGAKGIAVLVRWRDATGTILRWTTMTGGAFTATDGWWRYTFVPSMPSSAAASAPATSVEAQAYGLIFDDGKKWEAPTMSWRYPAKGKPTVVDKGVGLEVTAIERELFLDELHGKVFVEVTNTGPVAQTRVEVACDLNDRDGGKVVSDVEGSWVPRSGDHPHPALRMGEHDQIELRRTLSSDDERGAWAKATSASCKVRATEQ